METKKGTIENLNKGRYSKTNAIPSKKHLAFIEEYLKHFIGSKAYKAVYGENNSKSPSACALVILNRDDVQKYLNERLAERSKALQVDQAHVVEKLTEILEADFVGSTKSMTDKEIFSMPIELRKLVQSIELIKTSNHGENFDSTTEKYKVTFMSKDKALELLGKHTGAFAKDNVKGSYDLGKLSFTDALKELDI